MIAAALLAIAGCREASLWTPADPGAFTRQPAAEDRSELVEFRRILAQGVDEDGKPIPATERTVGYLEKHRGTLRGSLKEYELTYLLDPELKRVGMIDSDGQFYRFEAGGRAVPVTRDETARGVGTFFRLPGRTNVQIREFHFSGERPGKINAYSDFELRKRPPAPPPPPGGEAKPPDGTEPKP